jgi:aspartyl/asparaginyl-tRNA synthetase
MSISPPNIFNNLENYDQEILNHKEWFQLLINLQNVINESTMMFYKNREIKMAYFPITTGAISSPSGKGSDSIPVKVTLFDKQTYLTDSNQFLLEYCCRIMPKGCYYIMPSFRGEPCDERHLSQFYHSECEIPGNLEDIMNLVEEYIRYLSKQIYDKYKVELEKSLGDISHIENIINYKGKFKRITFNEAEKMLKNADNGNINNYIKYEDGYRILKNKGEKKLLELNNGIVWVTHYDILSSPFYQKTEGNSVLNADLLLGFGEVVGCGERHDNFMHLLKSLKIHEVDPKDYKWYLTMKEKHPLQTCGFGMGIERYFMWLLKCDDIRNMQIFLRMNGKTIIP